MKRDKKLLTGICVITIMLLFNLMSGCGGNKVDNTSTDDSKEPIKEVTKAAQEANNDGEISNTDSNDNNNKDDTNTNVPMKVKEEEEVPDYLKLEMKDNEGVTKLREAIWDYYINDLKNDQKRIKEVEDQKMYFGSVFMKYGIQTIGEPGDNGYPLYIVLHGGGQSDTPDMNDSQWKGMGEYYKTGIKSGIIVNPRGVRDTWDCHGNPESYPLYDRLIENMILFKNVDPNRVYIMGFSAGGDGVYMVSPRMTDRFAAAHMSAGHPNGINLANLYNMPIQLQVGELDTAYNRHTVTVEYDLKLDKLLEQYGGGFIHNAFVHYQKPHNFYDNSLADQTVIADNELWVNGGEATTKTADTNAVHFVDQYTRNPLPERIVWNLETRASKRDVTSFYWLRAAKSVIKGEIIANFNKESNTITIDDVTTTGDFSILLNEDMVDLFAPITLVTPKGTFVINAELSNKLIEETTYERGDRNYQFAAEILYSSLQ